MKSPLDRPITTHDLRKFGYTIGGIFMAIALLTLWFQHYPISMVTGLLGIYLLAGAMIHPDFLKGFYRGWWKVSLFIGHYMGIFWFSVIYWLLFMPVALIARMVGFDPLGLKKHRNAKTYWHERKGILTRDHYERQFSVEKSDDGS